MSSDLIMESEPLLPRRTPEKTPSSFWEGKDGALGWTVATAIMLINFITIGLGRMSGILYVDFMREYRVNRRLASAPFSVQQSTRNLFGPVVGLLGHRFGIRSVTIVGGLMGAGSAAACAYAEDITWITIFWGGVYGTGIAFTSTLSQVILDDYFERNLSSASGLSFSGGSVGAMVFSFVLQTTIDVYGLENTYFIMGGVILLVVPLAITLTSPPWLKVQSISKEGESLNKTHSPPNSRLAKSLSTADIFSIKKGIVTNKNLDRTQIISADPSFVTLKESRESFNKKDDSKLGFIYGTFEKNKSDTTFSIKSNVDQCLSPPSTSLSKQKSFENSVESEKENIAKFISSIEELYSDSKARVNKSSSQDSTEDEFYIRNSNRKKTKAKKNYTSTKSSEKELLPNDPDIVDSKVENNPIDSNLSATSGGCTSVATSEAENILVASNKSLTDLNYFYEENQPKKEIASSSNEKMLDKKTNQLSRNLSSANDLSYKLLYLRTNFQNNFPDLSFPKIVKSSILSSCEIDSSKPFDEKQNDAKLSTINDDLQSVTNMEGDISSISDNEVEKIASGSITDDKVVKSDINLHSKDEESGTSKNTGLYSEGPTTSFAKNSSSVVDQSKSVVQKNALEAEGAFMRDQRTTATEKNDEQIIVTNKQRSSRMKGQKSTSLVRESSPQRRSSWKERSLPSKLQSSEEWHSSLAESTFCEDPPRDGCCLVSHPIRMVLKLYLNPAFLVICLCRAVHLLTFMGVLTIIVDFSMDRGLLESDGKYAVTAMSLGDLLGRLCTGWVTDCMFIGLEKFMLIAMILIGLISISLPIIPPSTILLLVCVYSILQGSVFIRHPILVSKYTRTEERTVGMGFMTLFSGLLGFLMPIYIGHFRDGIGSYNQVFYINGAICAGIGLLWIFEPCLKKFVR